MNAAESKVITMQFKPVRHVRVGVRRVNRRINGARGNPGRTLCGAEITVHDMTFRDWVRMGEEDVQQWNVCKDCHSQILGCVNRLVKEVTGRGVNTYTQQDADRLVDPSKMDSHLLDELTKGNS